MITLIFDPGDRPRMIVRRAAVLVRDSYTRDWLWSDERGTWERMAAQLLERSADAAARLRMTPARVDEEIATAIAYAALNAVLEHAKQARKRKAKTRA